MARLPRYCVSWLAWFFPPLRSRSYLFVLSSICLFSVKLWAFSISIQPSPCAWTASRGPDHLPRTQLPMEIRRSPQIKQIEVPEHLIDRNPVAQSCHPIRPIIPSTRRSSPKNHDKQNCRCRTHPRSAMIAAQGTKQLHSTDETCT